MVPPRGRLNSGISSVGLGATTLIVVALLAACSAPNNTVPAQPSEEPIPSESSVDDTIGGVLDVDALWGTFASRYPDAERPDAQLVRYVDEQEIPQAMADCLIAAGWTNVTVRADGGVAAGPSDPAQQEAFDMSMFVCMVQYPLDPKYTVELSTERLESLYDYYVGDLKACLELEGYEVNDAPSKTTFIETFYDVGWTPYVAINNSFAGTEDAWATLNRACPQWPIDFFD